MEFLKRLFAHHEHTFHTAHGGAHLLYFGAALMEGHGLYAIMAGCLLAFGLLSWLFGQEPLA